MKAAVAGALGALVVLVLLQVGVVSFSWPDLGIGRSVLPRHVVTDDAAFEDKQPATVTRIEAVALDCRARIFTSVGVEGRREHRVAGLVYRTDTVTLRASGDVDTCVDADAVTVTTAEDGSVLVDVPGEAIRFVRPRVDAVESIDGVEVDKGFIGELTDLAPGVSDGDDLTMGALAFAQQVIGGGSCMGEAFVVTEQVLRQAYRDQAMAQGADPSSVEVVIGQPDLDQHPDASTLLGDEDTTFDIRDDGVRCTLSPGAHDGYTVDAEALQGAG